jgi:hypothetical protein
MNTYKSDDVNINDFIYCTEELGERPSKVVLALNFNLEEFKKIMSKYEIKVINTIIEVLPDIESNMVNEKNLSKISDKFFISYTHVDKTLPDGFITNFIVYHKIENVNEIENFVNDIISASEEIEEIGESNTKTIKYISNSQSGLILENMKPMLADYENIDLYFNDDALKATKKLIKKINKTEKGISILHGKRGSGKTTLLSYISGELKKPVIFLPISCIDLAINAGGIKSLIKEESVLLIDDCEILNADLYGKSSLTFANLLQLVDGLYSDEYNLNIILAFNIENEDDIDEDILESNNLLNIIKLEELKKEKAKELCMHLKLKNKVEESTLLIDIINNRISDNSETIGY